MHNKMRLQITLQTFTQHFPEYFRHVIMKCFEDFESDFLI